MPTVQPATRGSTILARKPPAGSVEQRHGTAVGLRDSEAEADPACLAATRFFEPIERFQHTAEFVLRYSRPFIVNADFH
jgi:hypothetical protein